MSMSLNFTKITYAFMAMPDLAEDGVRFAGQDLDGIVSDIVAKTQPYSIGHVVLGRATTPAWTQLPPANGIIAILIGLLLPGSRKTPAALSLRERSALARLRSRLLPGARLSLVGVQAGRLDARALGFAGGVSAFGPVAPRQMLYYGDLLVSS